MNYTLYEVGGRIRDQFLGMDSKDIDYTVVVEDLSGDPFQRFVDQITEEGFDIFEEKKSCFTVRSRFPEDHKFAGLTADFVMARKDVDYPMDSRVPITQYGTLQDDLIRRDFTVNAIARTMDGEIIDPFNGVMDLKDGMLRTPTDTAISFNQDPLRILRAFRFAVTKDLLFSDEIIRCIELFNAERMSVVSTERVRGELRKMFKHSTKRSLHYLNFLRNLNEEFYETLFREGLWFEPTKRQK